MALATDRAVVDLATFAPEHIGRTRDRTPEGFLLCSGVRIARTGAMMYAPDEMPEIEQGPYTAMITVLRDADVLFAADTILSFAGKPVTNDHPPCPVTPANFKTYAVGTVLNPRRGEGAESEYLVADLLISDAETIEALEAGKREVSAGYDCDVEQIKPGMARQTKNLGNHVALVERARGGPALSIQDKNPSDGGPSMATRNTRKILDGIRKAFKAKDEAALEGELEKAGEAMDDDEPDGDEGKTVVIRIEGAGGAGGAGVAADPAADEGGSGDDPYEARFKKIEDAIEGIGTAIAGLKPAAADEKPEGEKPEGEQVDDEAAEEEKEVDKTQAQDAMSKAEILSPGVRLPNFDAAAARVKRATITAVRRTALKHAIADSGRKVHVDAVLGGRTVDFDKAKPSEVAMIFDAAAAVARAAHNASAMPRLGAIPQGAMTAAKLQARIEERRKAGRA